MKGAEFIIEALVRHGVTTVFGYPGGAIMPVYDALVGSSLRHILCRHEQGASLAADGYARASGQIGVCLGTSGPGATNLVTGLANAYMDSVPMLAITGQVASHLIGTDAFQEIDTYGMTLPVVKHSYLVESANDLPKVIAEAIQIATSGRPGPVLIDVPKDVQNDIFQPELVALSDRSISQASAESLSKAIEAIKNASKPLAYIGGGVGLARAECSLQSLLKQWDLPAVSTLKGLGSCGDHSLHLGMLGMHGLKAANFAVQSCDLLLTIGARFDDRATGNLNEFAPNATVVHLDVDPAEFDKLRQSHVSVLGEFNHSLNTMSSQLSQLDIAPWRQWCREQKETHAWNYNAPGEGIYAPKLLKELSNLIPKHSVIACDVGQHQMWVAQHCEFQSSSRHLSSGGLGTMGYGLPAAIGAKFAEPETCVINVCGDGSFAMNIQELMTLIRYQLPVKILLIDNQSLGMVRQWQHLFFEDRFSETDLSDNPDFVLVAKAFGLQAKCITEKAQVTPALDWFIHEKEPCLLQVCISNKENVWPLVPPGASNSEMLEEAQK